MVNNEMSIELTHIDPQGSRHLDGRTRPSGPLDDHVAQVGRLVAEVLDALVDGLSSSPRLDPIRVKSAEATFGIAMSAEKAIAVPKASPDAVVEVKITIENASAASKADSAPTGP